MEKLAAPPGPAHRRWAIPQWLLLATGWAWRLLVVAVAVVATLWTLHLLRLVVVPALIALMIATLLAPVVTRMVDMGLPRIVATWLALLAMIGLLGGAGWLISLAVVDELGDNTAWTDVRNEIDDWLRTGPLDLSRSEVDSLEERVRESLTSGVRSAGAQEARLAFEIVGAAFLTVVLTFFFVKDGPAMWHWVTQRIAPRRRDAVDRAGRSAVEAVGGYVRGVGLAGIVDAVLIGTVLAILGVPLLLPLAALTFLGAFFPIVGATVAGALAALVALVTLGPREALIVAGAVLVIQQVEGDVILPVIMRRQVHLHPAVVLLALAVGGSLAGLLGAFVAVPLAAVLVAAVPELRPD